MRWAGQRAVSALLARTIHGPSRISLAFSVGRASRASTPVDTRASLIGMIVDFFRRWPRHGRPHFRALAHQARVTRGLERPLHGCEGEAQPKLDFFVKITEFYLLLSVIPDITWKLY